MTRWRWLGGAVVAAAGWLAMSGSAALAQTSTTSTTAAGGTGPTIDNDQSVTLAVASLVFGLLSILVVLGFLYLDRRRSFALQQRAAKQQQSVEAVSEDAFGARAGPGPKIIGPDAPLVGQETGYVLVDAPAGAAVVWTADGEATLSTTSGEKVRLTAGVAGAIHLTAALGDGNAVDRDLLAVAAARTTVPYLGKGYGSVVIALAVASVTLALGLTKVLEGQAIAGILGSLVTYSVARGTQAGAAAAAGGGDGG